MVASFASPIFNPIFLVISINIGIILFYLSIVIYQWRLSWAVWKTGWWVWILIPFVNFYLIYSAFSGIDLYTNAVNFFGLELNGSFIIAFMICVLISLPFWYAAIKKHFYAIVFTVWALNLVLVFWFSQNVFAGNLYLTYVSFILFSILLLIPLFFKYKFWKLLSIAWVLFAFVNVFFFYYLLDLVFNLPVLMNISINLIIGGLYFIVLSFFPNIKATKGVILVSAYGVSIVGTFLLVFSVLYLIILNLPIALNMAFIIIAFTLFTSRILKINPFFMNFLISVILIVNFSLLTYFTFVLIPGFENLNLRWRY